jgi:hypothetical protein
MRKGILIVGIALLVLGLIAIALPFATETQSVALQPGSAGEAYSPTSLVTSGTLTVSWSGASSTTTVSVYACTSSSCATHTSSSPVASGTGSSGSFSLSVSPGTTYEITQSGTTEFLVSLQTTGIAYAEVVGIALVVVGGVVAFLGYRAAPRARPAPPPEPSPDEQVVMPTREAPPEYQPSAESISDDENRARYVLSADQMQATAENVQVVIPSKPSTSDTPPPTAPGSRPPIRCTSCGTWNEPWLDVCRWCKRPLTHTGG